MSNHDQMVKQASGIVSDAVHQGIQQAFLILWPYMLGAFALVVILAIVKGRMERWERDHEYRRMARIFREENASAVQSPGWKIVCADCRREVVTSYEPQPELPTYCDECYRRRLGG